MKKIKLGARGRQKRVACSGLGNGRPRNNHGRSLQPPKEEVTPRVEGLRALPQAQEEVWDRAPLRAMRPVGTAAAVRGHRRRRDRGEWWLVGQTVHLLRPDRPSSVAEQLSTGPPTVRPHLGRLPGVSTAPRWDQEAVSQGPCGAHSLPLWVITASTGVAGAAAPLQPALTPRSMCCKPWPGCRCRWI